MTFGEMFISILIGIIAVMVVVYSINWVNRTTEKFIKQYENTGGDTDFINKILRRHKQ